MTKTRNCTALAIVCILSVWFSSNALGATYYVSPTGSASNPGTRAEPWSMSKANSTLAAGDTAVLLDGNYSTAIDPANEGTSGSLLTYEADNKHGAVFPNMSYPIDLEPNKSYIVIDGVKCTNNYR